MAEERSLSRVDNVLSTIDYVLTQEALARAEAETVLGNCAEGRSALGVARERENGKRALQMANRARKGRK